ncbi:hypothetical protein JYU34_009499 [Plutella xylostella]|uniref:Uncharacterized protein n=1 Tax=Plutella xylostella TaxID=51655 RepID=A0ABQ7QJM0_PLUXY|nr:hypothetical protein JYU34_009499 [Plutella xylostella]
MIAELTRACNRGSAVGWPCYVPRETMRLKMHNFKTSWSPPRQRTLPSGVVTPEPGTPVTPHLLLCVVLFSSVMLVKVGRILCQT